MPPKKKDKGSKGIKGKKGKAKPEPEPSKIIVKPEEVKPIRKVSTPKVVSCTNKVTENSEQCPSQCNCYQPLDVADPEYRTKPEFIYGGPFSEPKTLKTPSDYEKENEAIKGLELFKFRKQLVNLIAPPKKPKKNCKCANNRGTCICEPIQRKY